MSQTAGKKAALIALTVTALLILPISQPDADTTGRDFSRCIHTCNTAKQSCNAQCVSDCRALFPGDSQQQSACSDTCKSACVQTEQECKAVCRAIKAGTSSDEPS